MSEPATSADESGSDEPKLLLLHGFFSGRWAWDRIRTDLHDYGVTTVAPDHLGYGQYRRVRTKAYTIHALAEHLAPLVERERPQYVVGHSMGGLAALELDRMLGGGVFRKIGIVGLPVFENPIDGMLHQANRGRRFRIFMKTHGFSHLGCEVLNRSRFAWRGLAHRYAPNQPAEVLANVFDHNFASHYHGLRTVAFGGLVPALAAATKTEVALLHGTRDRTAPLERAQAVACAHGWAFETVPGANHQVIVDRPLAVSNWIQRQILRLPTPG